MRFALGASQGKSCLFMKNTSKVGQPEVREMAIVGIRLLRNVRQSCSALSRVQNVSVVNVVHNREFSASPNLR